jgi:hypothetical protein
MTQTLNVWLGPEIIYLYGTVNGVAATFTLIGSGQWQAEVERSADNNYALHLEVYSANGLEGTHDYTLYYGMLPLVTDRTQADAREVRQLIQRINRAGGWEFASAEDKARFSMQLKGAYNAEDLNRVGQVVAFLTGELAMSGYAVETEPKTNWAVEDIQNKVQMAAYLGDVKALKAGFYGTVDLPETMDKLTADNANNIEKLLEEIFMYIGWMRDGYRKCGTFKCGQGVILP